MNKLTKYYILIVTSIFCIQLSAIAQTDEVLNSIVGNYVIDLRPSPDSEAYQQNFIVFDVDDKSFKGSFYGTEIRDGLINRKFENTYLAFTTEDRSNTYYHFVKILNNRIEGLTYSSDRALIQPWTGLKKE